MKRKDSVNVMALKRRLDFTNVTDGFELIPKGIYNVYVFEMKEGTSGAGNDTMKLILKVADGEYKGRQIWTNLTFVESAMFKIREFLQACGSTVPKKALDIDFTKCIGKKLKVEVVHRTSKEKPDEPFADVKKFMPLNASNDDAVGSGNPPPTQDNDNEDNVPFK